MTAKDIEASVAKQMSIGKEVVNYMARVEGLARAVQQMALEQAVPLEAMNQQIKAAEGILRKARLATLRADIETSIAAKKSIDDVMNTIRKFSN